MNRLVFSFALAVLVAVFACPAFAADPAPQASALDDPYKVDWGARFEQARAAKDRRALIQIIELAPVPEWIAMIDKASQELAKQTDTPNIEKPDSHRSFLVAPGVVDKDANDGVVHIAPEKPIRAGSMILSQIPVKLPLEAASVSLSLKPATPGVLANLYEFTLVKASGGEYKLTSVLIAVGPGAAPGRIELVGSVTAKNRTGNVAGEIPLEVAIDVAPAEVTRSDVELWFFSAFAHRFIAATVMTGEKKTDWWVELLGGTNPELEKQNREPNSIKHDLVAYCYGEFLRQIANADVQTSAGSTASESSDTSEASTESADAATDSPAIADGFPSARTMIPATDDPVLVEAAKQSLMELEAIELKRAQYIAVRSGQPLPAGVEAGYWWKGGSDTGFETDVTPNYKLPPRYRH
jgi:hypothetical protein